MQHFAEQAVRSNFRNTLVDKLAALGSHGRFLNNIHGQLMSLFGMSRNHETIVETIDGCCVTHIIHPHSLFRMLFVNYPGAFESFLGADVSKTVPFWDRFLQSPYGRHLRHNNVFLQGKSRDELAFCVPLLIHGDGVPVTKKKSSIFVQWGGVLGESVSYQSTRLAPTLSSSSFVMLVRVPGVPSMYPNVVSCRPNPVEARLFEASQPREQPPPI